MRIIGIIALTILSGWLYRLGGWGGEGRKEYPNMPGWMFDSKARDIGCSLCGTAAVALLIPGISWWAHLLSFLMLFGALTTYWDFLFGYDNHYFHGLMCALAYFPIALDVGDGLGFAIRIVVTTVGMGFFSGIAGKDDVEEVGRGMVLIATVPLLLIGA